MRLEPYNNQPHPAPCDLDLSTGVSCLPHTRFADLVAEIQESDIRCYPDTRELEARYASMIAVPASWVTATAGADDAIDRICRVTLDPGAQALWTAPGFSMIPRYVSLSGAELKEVVWREGIFPRQEYIDAVEDSVRLLVLVSPQNPTGAGMSIQDVQAIASLFPDRVVLVDEAYVEFAQGAALGLVKMFPNLVVTRTMSKARRGAGLRVGFAIGRPEMIKKIRAAGSPFPVSGPSLRIAQALLETSCQDLVQEVQSQRERLRRLALELGARVSRSHSNCVLWHSGRAGWIRNALAGLGISTRAFAAPALRDDLRITCPGTPEAMQRLEGALRTAMEPSLLLFDMDGVLFDVSGSYRACIQRTAQSFGVHLGPGAIEAAKARGNANDDWALAWRLLVAAGVDCTLAEVTERFESYYQDSASGPGLWRSETPLVDRFFLQALQKKIPLGIVTGRPRKDAERSLAQHDIAECFSVLVCREDAALKPSPEPIELAIARSAVESARAWYIGDTPDDMVAARACGVIPIGHAPPHCDKEALRASLFQAGASRVLDSLSPLLELLP